jgi:hypothetical protein
MATTRTTIVLDEASRQSARRLAARWGCSGAEVIRRALVAQDLAVLGSSRSRRAEKRRLLVRLFDLFEGVDANAEIAQRKAEDAYF